MGTIDLRAINHLGIRVADLDRSVAFYGMFGFELMFTGGPEPVAILRNANGVEINLIINANDDNDGKNILMDVESKYAGYTHAAFTVESINHVVALLEENGIAITEGPVNLGGTGIAVFIRDPDSNVLELHQPLDD